MQKSKIDFLAKNSNGKAFAFDPSRPKCLKGGGFVNTLPNNKWMSEQRFIQYNMQAWGGGPNTLAPALSDIYHLY